MSIERNFNKYLFNLVKSNAMDNKVAKTIVLNYIRLNRDTKEKFFESLMLPYANFSESAFNNIKFEATSNLVLADNKGDFRLKSVRLANVRGIPEQKNNTKYGVDLFEDGQILNAVILGPNGTGKSSLFNAIEFIYSHEVAENKLRVRNPGTLNENDFLNYLEHFNEAPECEIVTPTGKFSLRNRIFKTDEELKIIYPDAHFISDYDIYSKGQLNYLGKNDDSESFHLLIASSLGLQDYLDFTNLLKSISTYRRTKESIERNKLIANKNSQTLENVKNLEQIKIKSERIKELKLNYSDNVIEDSREKLIAIIETLKSTSYTYSFDESEYLKTFNDYRIAKEKFLGLSVNQDLQTEAQFLSLGLELINNSENCPLCENSKSTVPDIKRKIEKRILEIKEFETVSKYLEQSINNIQNAVKDLLTTLQSVERTLKIEVDRIIAIPELDDIFKDEKDLIDLLDEETISLIGIDKSISNIISSNNVLTKKDEAIAVLINNKEGIMSIDVANTLSKLKIFIINRQKKIAEISTTLSVRQNLITPKQQILIFESEIKNHQSAIDNNVQQIKTLEEDIEKLTKTIDTIGEIKLKAGEFAKVLEVDVNKLVASSFEPIKETITTILSEYLKEENVSLQIKLEKQTSVDDPESVITTILAEIQRINTQTGELEIHSPSKYFNTFRFRLFCTMVSISIVIAARRNSGINLPIVLDDIFYSSDYNNKTTFRQFITTVLNIFRKFNGEMPLQFILFTHDELVFDSALDAIEEFEMQKNDPTERYTNDEWEIPIRKKTLFARLFSAKDIEPTTTESQFGNFWDLTYKIPTQLEELLKES